MTLLSHDLTTTLQGERLLEKNLEISLENVLTRLRQSVLDDLIQAKEGCITPTHINIYEV